MGAVNAALGRVFASVPESQVMDVYNAVSGITDGEVPAYLKSLVNGADADKAYEGFLAFKDVVKSKQVSSAAAPPSIPSGDKIGAAAEALAKQSYPFIKDVNWLSDLYTKPLPGATADKVLKAAALAHHNAIGSIDGNGVTSLADYTAVVAGLGRVFASVPKAQVMDVYNAFAALTPGAVPNKLFESVKAADAQAAAKAFYTFKDVVAASQR